MNAIRTERSNAKNRRESSIPFHPSAYLLYPLTFQIDIRGMDMMRLFHSGAVLQRYWPRCSR